MDVLFEKHIGRLLLPLESSSVRRKAASGQPDR
jgi:hypothetical protein